MPPKDKNDKKDKKKPKKKQSSAEKRAKQEQKRRLRNNSVKSAIRTFARKVEEAVANKDVEAAKAALTIAIPKWDKAASKGVIHRNNAARKISRLTRKVNAIMAPATVEATS